MDDIGRLSGRLIGRFLFGRAAQPKGPEAADEVPQPQAHAAE
jgi:hypothetical protein